MFGCVVVDEIALRKALRKRRIFLFFESLRYSGAPAFAASDEVMVLISFNSLRREHLILFSFLSRGPPERLQRSSPRDEMTTTAASRFHRARPPWASTASVNRSFNGFGVELQSGNGRRTSAGRFSIRLLSPRLARRPSVRRDGRHRS